ncbi:MAG: DUF2088 domain-containing protein [Planctomycetes bacterium]|nr:DUF2088 domain-containing protein [Planctomycetota bacterium]
MSTTLHYGRDSTLELSLDRAALVTCSPELRPLADWSQALQQALDAPTDYLPLASAVTPGDRVAVAVEPGTPRAEAIVAQVVDYLLAHGIAAADIAVLQHVADPANTAADLRELLSPAARDGVTLHRHDPSHRDNLGYVANTRGGKPVYLNRVLSDADAVVFIGCLRSPRVPGSLGPAAAIYPGYSDGPTMQRFRHPALLARRKEYVRGARREIDQVAWLAGSPFVVEVIPGPGGTIAGFVSGDLATVKRVGAERMADDWETTAAECADLVVAAVSGEAEQQTWENVGRALAAAVRLVNSDGAIVLCTELATAPGAGLQVLSGSESWDRDLKQLEDQRPADLLAATMLIRAHQQARIYLLSQLDESTVEGLGMIHVTEPADVGRLIARSDSCVVLPDAQFAWPTVEEGRGGVGE